MIVCNGALLLSAPTNLWHPTLSLAGPGRALLAYVRYDDSPQVRAGRIGVRTLFDDTVQSSADLTLGWSDDSDDNVMWWQVISATTPLQPASAARASTNPAR